MNRVSLANTGRETSQLGYGCTSLMGARGRKESLALLEEAYEAGIRHFDVAPMYGYGAAEGCLGEFLARHLGDTTVTTKYGIPPPPNQGLMRVARRTAGSVLKFLPTVKKRLAAAANSAASASPKSSFTAVDARASLHHSLAELRTGRIDLFLLHEAEAGDLMDDTLLRLLQDNVAGGKIGAFGCGSGAEKIPALLRDRPAFCPVVQFEWSVLNRALGPVPAFTLHHRALSANFGGLQTALRHNRALLARWSSEVGADLAQPGTLASLMLKAALIQNPDSVILVSSTKPAHIRDNVRVADDNRLAEPARRLYALAQREGTTVLAPT